jgi:hypothetical protein
MDFQLLMVRGKGKGKGKGGVEDEEEIHLGTKCTNQFLTVWRR